MATGELSVCYTVYTEYLMSVHFVPGYNGYRIFTSLLYSQAQLFIGSVTLVHFVFMKLLNSYLKYHRQTPRVGE